MNAEISPELALAALRVVALRLKSIESEVTAIGIALKHGMITARTALTLTDEIAPGCFGAVAASIERKTND